VITDPAQSISFTAAPWECGSAAIEYQVTGTPTHLITLPDSHVSSITFAQTTSTADIGEYTLNVEAQPVGATTWTSFATAKYTYNNPCPTTSIATVPDSIENLVAFAG
jgi:hypothetical protein